MLAATIYLRRKRRRWCRLLKKAALVPPLTTGKAALVSKEAALVSKKAVRQPHQYFP